MISTPPISTHRRSPSKKLDRLNGGQEHPTRRLPAGRGAKAASVHSRPTLDPEASAALRDQLAAELKDVDSAEEAANWAHWVLDAKNSLTAADATRIEEAFRAKLAIFATDAADRPEMPHEAERPLPQRQLNRGKKGGRPTVIDKSVLALPELRRVRDREHVRYVIQQPCLICGRRPSVAHHLRFAQNRALSRKVSDEFTVPLCRGHHREVHRSGDEAAWWNKANIDPTVTARALWLDSHPLPANPDKIEPEGAPSVSALGSDQSSGKHNRPVHTRGPNYKTWR
jgi:hypothetical protein